jgi:predicted ATP-dependent endonuclease of OLD family
MSDGVRAFTGIITEVIAGDPNILLIDEPEAFLHPSLAYKLGKECHWQALKRANGFLHLRTVRVL